MGARGVLRWLPLARHWYAEYVSEEDYDYVRSYGEAAYQFFQRVCDDGRAIWFEGSG